MAASEVDSKVLEIHAIAMSEGQRWHSWHHFFLQWGLFRLKELGVAEAIGFRDELEEIDQSDAEGGFSGG